MRKNKISASAILLLLIFFSQSDVVQAQKKQRKYFHPAPTRLMLPGDENEDREFDKGILLREHFYPIGWSNDGSKFAFLVEPADEACGCYFAHFVIQDVRDDKILWEKKYEGDERAEESLKTFWQANRREFSDRLDEHKIIVPKRFVLEKPDFAYKGDQLDARLAVNTKEEDFLSVSGDVTLQLVSKRAGAKTIYERKFDPKKLETFMDAELGGVLVAPFEARAAVIVVETYRGYEGPPHITRLRIVGADLINGFR